MSFKNLQIKRLKMIGLVIIPLLIVACSSLKTDQSLTEIDWQWIEMVETEPASQSLVPHPENYTLQLLSDGTINIKADCNMASGSYKLESGGLTIELGPTTLAYCGDESLDHLFLGFLSNVERYTVENGQLVLELQGGAGQMTFSR